MQQACTCAAGALSHSLICVQTGGAGVLVGAGILCFNGLMYMCAPPSLSSLGAVTALRQQLACQLVPVALLAARVLGRGSSCSTQALLHTHSMC